MLKKLKDAINENLQKENWRTVFLERLEGKTLANIALKRKISRQRVKQIFDYSLNKIPTVQEDKYKEIFEKYMWNEKIFCSFFEENYIIFNYLNLKYKVGSRELKKIYNEEISEKQKKVLVKYFEDQEKEPEEKNWNDEFKKFVLQNEWTTEEVSKLTGLSKFIIDNYIYRKRKPILTNKQILKEKLGFDC